MSTKFNAVRGALAAAALACLGSACYDKSSNSGGDEAKARIEVTDLPGHEGLAVDGRRKERPRTMAAEVYLRSYAMLFGELSPIDVAQAAAGKDRSELFESWSAYVGALGLPNYADDLARSSDTNALMLATYERLGIALCDRAVERDLRGGSPRAVFDFDLAPDPLERSGFDTRFDVLHRTFLGYPAKLAGTRADRFHSLFSRVLTGHGAAGAASSRFSSAEAGWAVVCYALVRHPEFHLY